RSGRDQRGAGIAGDEIVRLRRPVRAAGEDARRRGRRIGDADGAAAGDGPAGDRDLLGAPAEAAGIEIAARRRVDDAKRRDAVLDQADIDGEITVAADELARAVDGIDEEE